MQKLCLLTLSLLLSSFLSLPLPAYSEPQALVDSAEAECRQWLMFLDRREYESGYDRAGSTLHEMVKLTNWVNTLTAIRSNFGEVNSRTLSSHNYLPQGFDGKEGEFMRLTFTVKFSEVKKPYFETVVLQRDSSGWVAVGYNLEPPPPTQEELAALPAVTQDTPSTTNFSSGKAPVRAAGNRQVIGDGHDISGDLPLPH